MPFTVLLDAEPLPSGAPLPGLASTVAVLVITAILILFLVTRKRK